MISISCILLVTTITVAQDRETKVRNDRATFQDSQEWLYEDLKSGFEVAAEEEKPMMVVVRCIPCEACQEFDDDVARRDPIIRDLMDEFVCVRLVKGNDLDLTQLQFDFDQSMAIIFLHPDGTVLGRYGTRSERPEYDDISLEGLRASMTAVLKLMDRYAVVRPALEGKQPLPTPYRRALDFPSLAERYTPELDYEGQVVQSCIHCHQVRDAERLVYREARKPIPDEVLYPYPDPSILGISIDPQSLVKVSKVEPGSIAAEAGVEPGDLIRTLQGQPLVSTADLQWVLHQVPSESATLTITVDRSDDSEELALELGENWRRQGNLSWRVTTWELRRMALGGLRLKDLNDERRAELGLEPDSMALLAEHVGQYDEHAVAKRAGFVRGDIIVQFAGRDDRMTESGIIAHLMQQKNAGDTVNTEVLRGDRLIKMSFKLQ